MCLRVSRCASPPASHNDTGLSLFPSPSRSFSCLLFSAPTGDEGKRHSGEMAVQIKDRRQVEER